MSNISGKKIKQEKGMTLLGLIFVLALIGIVMIVAAQVAPTVVEYMTIKKAIQTAKSSGQSVQEIQSSFDKQADVGYVTAIKGKDLIIETIGNNVEVSFAYTKKIHLFGPASLLLEYEGTTAKTSAIVKKQE